MKQFSVICDFGGTTGPVIFYIYMPHPDKHPIFFQNKWLSSARGGTVPQNIMDSLEKLQALAYENGVSFEELAYYAMVNGNNQT